MVYNHFINTAYGAYIMNVNLELYRIFDTVARVKSFSAAARELFISQPAVSQSIRQLEEALDVKLFIRGSKGITMTTEGQLLEGYISSAMSLIESGERRISRLNDLSAGELHIGAGDTVSKWFLLPLMERFHSQFPDVNISLINRVSSDTVGLLKAGKIDIGFVNMPMSADGVLFEECLPIHDTFVASSKFSQLRGRKVELPELAANPLMMLEQATNSRRWVDRHFAQNGIVLSPAFELGSHELLADYARIGLGVACVVREFVGDALVSGDLFEVDLANPVPRRSIGLCYMENISLSAAARKFMEMAKLGVRD